MHVTIKLFAHFRDGRFKEAEHQFAPGVDCRQIILGLGFRLGEMGIVMVNGQHAPLDYQLNERDTLALFPLVGGG
ncbi:MAG: MoaD/ThiS family protein [Geothrix sp.]|nr:MoaD/ThiS family protein [Geothrix sp.]